MHHRTGNDSDRGGACFADSGGIISHGVYARDVENLRELSDLYLYRTDRASGIFRLFSGTGGIAWTDRRIYWGLPFAYRLQWFFYRKICKKTMASAGNAAGTFALLSDRNNLAEVLGAAYDPAGGVDGDCTVCHL